MTDQTEITLAHRVQRLDEVLFQNLDGEAVLLDLSSETYFGLNEVGTRIWQLIETAPPLSEVHRALCAEFDADAARIEHDLLALVGDLAKAGLVAVH